MINTNMLIAIKNIIKYKLYNLKQYNTVKNYNIRINNIGSGLENLIKNAFCENFNNENTLEYNKYFSYLGNQNNPPDLIIKNGDAIEIKKIESNERSTSFK